MPTVYLAGPMVFRPQPEVIFARMKSICARHGLEGVSPMDSQIGLEGLHADHHLMTRIVGADIELMRRLDAGIFCLDPMWAAPEMDAGTAFEVGYMSALGKPLVGWTSDGRDFTDKIASYFLYKIHSASSNAQGATSGDMRAPDGTLLHSATCVQNGMVHVGIEMSGGQVFCDRDWEHAFEAAVRQMAGLARAHA